MRTMRREAAWSQALSKPLPKPLPFGEGPAPDPPCKCTPNSPAACLTTPPPRCDELGWSSRPWGWLGISRGDPGPVVAGLVRDGHQKRNQREEKNNNNNSQDEARNRGLRLEGNACGRRVIASAMEERFAFCGSDEVRAGVKVRLGDRVLGTREGARRRRVIAFAIEERFAFSDGRRPGARR